MNLKYAQFKKKAGGQVWKIAAFRHNGLTALSLLTVDTMR